MPFEIGALQSARLIGRSSLRDRSSLATAGRAFEADEFGAHRDSARGHVGDRRRRRSWSDPALRASHRGRTRAVAPRALTSLLVRGSSP